MYHDVGDRDGDSERELVPPISRARLARQLAYLRRHYRVVELRDLQAATAARQRGEPFPVAVTFDDDLGHHVTHALPELRAIGAPATFFLCGSFLEEPRDFWWQRLQRAVDGGADVTPLLGTGTIHRQGQFMEALAPERRDAAAGTLRDLAAPVPQSDLLTEEDARRLPQIGFHTTRHDPLTQLDDEQLVVALSDGRQGLAAVAGYPVDVIAYPHGNFDSRVVEATRQQGFSIGVTSDRQAVTPDADPLVLGRYEVPVGASIGVFAFGLVHTLLISPPSMTDKTGSVARRAADRLLPRSVQASLYGRARRLLQPRWSLGTPRRLVPVAREFGSARGKPIDRYYIDDFLRRYSGSSEYAPGAIHGHVLEIGEDTYTRRFGLGVERTDILHASPDNPRATIVADLTDGSNLPSDTYDCIICLQTLLVIYDVKAAIRTIHRILKPGGTVLVTVPGISQISRTDIDSWGDYWRFTTLSARRLFEEVFDPAKVTVDCYGNVLTASAFLYGLVVKDMSRRELDLHDPDYQVIIGIKAVK
jgi:peptidoglycan/xylan/chitin deacetylase (PgdA/CDA1 family)/SAM-dependent methyltransferase